MILASNLLEISSFPIANIFVYCPPQTVNIYYIILRDLINY